MGRREETGEEKHSFHLLEFIVAYFFKVWFHAGLKEKVIEWRMINDKKVS